MIVPENELSDYQRTLLAKIATGTYRNIIILSGAGVSTSAGIPDYRSMSGQFSIFGMKPFTDRKVFDEKKSEHDKYFEGKLPTYAHTLATLLYSKGWLRRVYTQNIDGLYQKAGLPVTMLVEAHGNLSRGDIVLYGESLPRRFEEMVVIDFLRCTVPPDLLLVMGTSLQVAPFCALANFVPRSCTRVLMTLHINEAMSNHYNKMKGEQYVKFAKHRVSLKSKWGRKYQGRWPNQYLINFDVEALSKELMSLIK